MSRLWWPISILGFALYLSSNLSLALGEEKLLLGFEKEEDLARWFSGERNVKLIEREGGYELSASNHPNYNVPLVLRPRHPQAGFRMLRPEEVTEGKLALLYITRPWGMGMSLEEMRSRHRHDGGRPDCTSFPWCSFFADPRDAAMIPSFPPDWSGYDFLRLDVRPRNGRAVIVLWMEDEEVEPMIRRVFAAPSGKWSTLEVDIAQEAKGRGLDLAHMRNFGIEVREDSAQGEILFDNLRLAQKKVPAKFEVVRPDLSLANEYVLPTIEPGKYKTPVSFSPDRSPITLGSPLVIDEKVVKMKLTSFPGNEAVAAYDNQHMLVLWNHGALQTLDGGATWKLVENPDGFSWIGRVAKQNLDEWFRGHQVLRLSTYVDPAANIYLLSCPGCCGLLPGNRLFNVKLAFVGKEGWKLRPECLVTADPRHCTHAYAQVRLPGGRLWIAWGQISRQQRREVHAKYSDDDGITWHSWRKNKNGMLPDSRGLQPAMVAYQNFAPALAPFGQHVACFWADRRGLLWTVFDGQMWSKPQVIEPSAAGSSASDLQSEPLCSLGLPSGEVLLATPKIRGLLRWDGKTCRKELVEAPSPPNSYLTLSGQERVLLFAIVDGKRIVCYRRGKNGSWSGPSEVVREDQSIKYFYVPPQSPPNFSPLIWACQGETWLKLLRVPVE